MLYGCVLELDISSNLQASKPLSTSTLISMQQQKGYKLKLEKSSLSYKMCGSTIATTFSKETFLNMCYFVCR